MSRPDLIQSLKDEIAAATHAPILPPNSRYTLRAAHGRLDVLGALGAHAGATLAQLTLPTRLAVALQLRPADPTLIARSDQIAPPVGESDISLPLAPLLKAPPDQAPAIITQLAAGAAQWAAPLLAIIHTFHHHTFSAPGSAGGNTVGLPAAPSGLSLLIKSQLPLSAGQASSTALIAATLLALLDAHHLTLDTETQASLVADAHSLIDPHADRTARLIDARTCLQRRFAGDPPRLLRYSTQPYRYVGPVPLPSDVRLLALDTGVARHASAANAQAELRTAGAIGFRLIETIYRDLGQDHTPLHGHLANTSPLLYRHYFRTLLPRRMRGSDFLRAYPTPPQPPPPPADGPVSPIRRFAGSPIHPEALYRVRTAVDHFIAEHEHAEQFLQAMEELAEDRGALDPVERRRILQRAGRLLLASHHSYRLRLELSCREADWLVDRLMAAGPDRGVFGARITGPGTGGTVVALLERSPSATDALLATLKAYHQLTGLNLSITEA